MMEDNAIVFGKEIEFYTTVKEVSEKQNLRDTNKIIKTYKKTIMSAAIFNFQLHSSRIPAFISFIEGFIKNHFTVGQSVSFAEFEVKVIQKDGKIYLHIKDLESNAQNTFTKIECDYIFRCYELVSREIHLFDCVSYTNEVIESIKVF